MVDKRALTSGHEGALRSVVFEEPAELAPHLAAWDALAVGAGRPFCAPAWMLAWWHEARIGDARLRTVLVFDGTELAAVGPFFAQVAYGLTELRLLAAGFSHRIGVLARDQGPDVVSIARTLAEALASIQPRAASIVFEGIDGSDPWPGLIARHWPAHRAPRRRTDATMQAPVIDLVGSYEQWLDRRERRFRKETRRTARRMEEEEVRGEVVCDERALETLLRLHYIRWEGRGGSNVERTGQAVLRRAASELASIDRLWVALLEGPSGAVAAELVVRAGDTAAFWEGGFDPAWARYAPGTQAMLLALRRIAEQSALLVDLGGGDHDYKRKLADRNTTIVWCTVFPRGARYPLIRMRLAPKHMKFWLRKLARRLPAPTRELIKRARSGWRTGS